MIDIATHFVTTTHRLHAWAAGNDYRCWWLTECLTRHNVGDWGDLDDTDIAANDHATNRDSGRLVSAYPVPEHLATSPDPVVWIITDDLDTPHPTTTMLWPSDY
jgi:hypothetical protein